MTKIKEQKVETLKIKDQFNNDITLYKCRTNPKKDPCPEIIVKQEFKLDKDGKRVENEFSQNRLFRRREDKWKRTSKERNRIQAIKLNNYQVSEYNRKIRLWKNTDKQIYKLESILLGETRPEKIKQIKEDIKGLKIYQEQLKV
jgi:hypothetical protein